MDYHNRRVAIRVDCDLPVRLKGDEAQYVGRIVDLSRSGMRMRLPGRSLGVHRLSSLVEVTRRLNDALGHTFLGELHYEMLGPLVHRTLTPCRIAKRDWEQTDVEVGCQFDRPLTDDEIRMLGVALPAVGRRKTAARPEAAVAVHRKPARRVNTRPHLPEPEEDSFLTYIYPAPGKNSKPLMTRTRSLTRGMAILEVETGQGWDLPDVPVSDLVMALDAAYGTDILLRVVDGDRDLWTGPAEVQEIDLNPKTRRLKLGVAFGRELRSEELGRLGLPTPA